MSQAEILAFPSFVNWGWGLLRQCGMACVVVDYGGPAMLVQERGIKISMGNFDHLVRRFTEELEQLVTNPDRVAHLGHRHHHAITH